MCNLKLLAVQVLALLKIDKNRVSKSNWPQTITVVLRKQC